MSKFIKLLKSTLEKYGHIPSEEKGEEFNELVSIFEESVCLREFLTILESERKRDSSSSLARLLRGINREGKIIMFDLGQYLIEEFGKEENNEHFEATLIDIFFELKPTTKEKETLTEIILAKSEVKFPILESILIHVTKYLTENDSLFCDVYLRALNAKRGTYGGAHWFQDAYVRIAKSPELSRFIETITSSGYEKAFELFIEGSDDTLRLFFDSIPPTDENFEIIKSLLTKNSTGEDPIHILSHYHGYNQKVFLDAIFNFLSKSGSILPYIEPFLGENYGIFETREYTGDYINKDEIPRLGEILTGEKMWGIMRIFEYIQSSSERSDKAEILDEFRKIPGFQNEQEKTRLSREKYEQEEDERVEKERKDILTSILSVAKMDEEDVTKISPLLIDLYKKHKKEFTKEHIEIVKAHLKRFFAWKLFPLDEVEFTRTQTSPGSHSFSYTNSIWYREGFFLDTLAIANELDIPYPSHEKLVRALALLWIGDESKKQLIPAIGSLTREDIEILGKVYDGSRTDQLCEFMGGQNFFEIYKTFESDWKREKDILREILYAFIEKHEVEDYIRERAIETLSDSDIWDETSDTISIRSLWEKEILKYPENIVENYERTYSYLLSINQILINHGEEDAINWRFDQLLHAKVDFPDPWENYENNRFARRISELESELSHDGVIISGIKNINIIKHEDNILKLFNYGTDLIIVDRIAYGIFASYLIGTVFDIILAQANTELILRFKKRIELKISQYSGEKVRLVNYKFQEFNKRIEARTIILPIEEKNTPKDEEKITVFLRTEGESDIIHLENAIKYLKLNSLEKCSINNGRSASELQYAFKQHSYPSNEILICISDYDEAGIKGFHRHGVYTGLASNGSECGLQSINNKHYIIIPITSDVLINQVINRSSTDSISENEPGLEKNRLFRNGKPEFIIEHLFYFDGFDLWNDRFFESDDRGTGDYPYKVIIPRKKEIGDNNDSKKVEFAKNIAQIAIQEFSMKGEELYRNFIPLFEKINEIIKNHENDIKQTPTESISEKSS